MTLDKKELALRDSLADLADEAGSVLAGTDATVWTQTSLKGMNRDTLRQESDRILDEVGVSRIRQARVFVTMTTPTLADKRALLTERLTQGAKLVLVAARNFENLPEETVNTLYDQIIELDKRAASRK